MRAPHREVDERIERIEFEAALGMGPGEGRLAGEVIGVVHERRLEVHEREAGVRACEARVLRHGASEQRGRHRVVHAVEAVHVLQAEVVGRPRIEVLGHLQSRHRRLVQRNLDLERREDLRADLVAHRMHVVQRAREALGPDDAGVARVDQFDRDGDSPARDLDGAGQAVAHAEQAADLEHVRLGERRRNDEPRAVTKSQRSRDSSVISSYGSASAMAA